MKGIQRCDDVPVLDLKAGYMGVCKNLHRNILNDLSTFLPLYFNTKYI